MARETSLTHVSSDRLLIGDSTEQFDRLRFAKSLLRLLAPPRMTVAVYECRRELRVERGRDFAGGPDASFGILGIPRTASRQHIVLAVAELAGVADQRFLVDALSNLPLSYHLSD